MTTPAELLNPEQKAALEDVVAWVKRADPAEPFFLLSGSAGTGKTFVVQVLIDMLKGRMCFTAPTNKATKVLRDTLTRPDFKPECRTIFSLLGLRLEANGEVKELTIPEDPVDLTSYRLIVVDEGSMVNANLEAHIRAAARDFGCKFLFMGDAAQLPPVGERLSVIWSITPTAHLSKVMRHDNQVLTLATRLRAVVDHPAPTIKLLPDNKDGQGVFMPPAFLRGIAQQAELGNLTRVNHTKVIAWRNVTVDRYNQVARAAIFKPEVDEETGYSKALPPWLEGDRVIFTSPAKDLDDEVVATTDDEGTVMQVGQDWHPLYAEFRVWRLAIVLDDNKSVSAIVLHPGSQRDYERKVIELGDAARADRRRWKNFWDFKEAFHQLRHAYAITAHRAQGSTYEAVWVDYRDILLNRNRQEAYRCLYVACTRPKRELHLG